MLRNETKEPKTETKDTPSSFLPASADVEKIKRLISLIKGAAANAKTAAGKDIVLVIGPTGAGKSTLINCFMHKELMAVESDTGEYEFAARDSKDETVGPKIGHGESCTIYPEAFLTKEGLAFCDTAGFFDTRSKEHSQSAYYALQVVVSVAKSVKGILFVCDIDTMKAAKGQFFVNAVRLLTTILRTSEEYGRSVFFLITKAQGVSHKQVMAIIEKKQDQLEAQGEELAAKLLELLVEKPDSVITVGVKDLVGKAGLDFAWKMYGRLKDAQIKSTHFKMGDGGKEEYLQAYHHLMSQAFHQIQALTWKTDDLMVVEEEIKTIEQNMSNNQAGIIVTEEKRQETKNDLANKKLENERELKALNDRLRAIPDEVRRLEEAELKEIEEIETRRCADYIEEIKRQHEAALKIGQEGADENIAYRQEQIAELKEKNRQVGLQIEAKHQEIKTIGEEIKRFITEHENANRALDEEAQRLQAGADELINSLQREGNYQNFPAIREIKGQIQDHRTLIARLNDEIETLGNDRHTHQNRIIELKNDDSDYRIHNFEWSEAAVFGGTGRPKVITRGGFAGRGRGRGIVRHIPYKHTASLDIKRDECIAVTTVAEGSPGSVTDRFLKGRECGGTYHTPSHTWGSFSHNVYIHKKYSQENIEEAERLRIVCEGLVARQAEKHNRKEQPQRDIERLSGELTARRNDEEKRIREQTETRRLAIENRRVEARRLFEAAQNERNQRIQALRNEINTLEGSIATREATIATNQTAIIEIKQNGRVDLGKLDQQKVERIREAEKKKEETIAQRQQAARERVQRDDKVGATQREITIQTESGRQIQEAGEKFIQSLEDELERKRQAALNYGAALRQGKERRTSLLKDLNVLNHEFMEMKSNYDAVVDLFTLLKLGENYLKFVNIYQEFLKVLFVKVSQLVNPMAIPLESKNSDKPTKIPFESKASDTEQQKANAVFVGQLIGNEPLLKALFYEGARGVSDLDEKGTFFDRKESENRTCFMNTLQRQVILLHQLQKQNIDYKFVEDSKYLNHLLDCGDKGRILLPELRIEFKDGQLSQTTQEQFRFLLETHLSKGKDDRPLFIPIHVPGHFTLLSLEKKDNKVYYRYIDSLNNFMPGQEDLNRVRKNKLAEIIQSVVGSEPVEIQTAYLKQQTNGSGEHYNECAMHTVFATLYQLKQGIGADMSLMRKHLQLPGKNVTGNGGLDSEDALSAIPNYRSLCESLHEQVTAAAKAKAQMPSVADSSSTLYGKRSPSPKSKAEQQPSDTFRATR